MLARERILLHDPQTGGGGDFVGPVNLDAESITNTSSIIPVNSQLGDALRDRGQSLAATSRAGQHDRDGLALGGEQPLQRELPGPKAAPLAPVGCRQIILHPS